MPRAGELCFHIILHNSSLILAGQWRAVGSSDWLDVNLPPVDQPSDHKAADAAKDENGDVFVSYNCVRQANEQSEK
jgi:hypothetical protein